MSKSTRNSEAVTTPAGSRKRSPDRCKIDRCERPVSALGLCVRHYNQKSRGAVPQPDPPNIPCPVCGVVVDRSLPFAVNRQYCSPECRKIIGKQRRKEAHAAQKERLSQERREAHAALLASTVKQCIQCGKDFTPKQSVRQTLCSAACRGARHSVDSKTRTCGVDGCDLPMRARDMCAKHYRRWARQTGREKAEAWSPQRYERWKRRQDQIRATKVQPIRNIDIFERDGWTCALCHQPIDPDLMWPDPACATLDHIVPLSKGGQHTLDNVQAAHARCNISKGDDRAS